MTRPSIPAKPLLASLTQDTVDVSWTPPNNGGKTIIEYQIGYSTSPAAPVVNLPHVISPHTVTGLTPGVTYFFFVRARNADGFSTSWSVPSGVRTVPGAYIGVLGRTNSGAIVNGGFWGSGVPYVNVGGVWKMAEVWVNNQGTWTRVTT
jgi:hypothetical protein